MVGFCEYGDDLRVPNPTATFLAANIFNISINILHNEVYLISTLVIVIVDVFQQISTLNHADQPFPAC
jgi:hypothetical protein